VVKVEVTEDLEFDCKDTNVVDSLKMKNLNDNYFESMQNGNYSELNPFPENNSSLPISVIKKEIIVPEDDEQSFHVHEEKNVHVQSVHKDKPRIKCSLCDRHYQGNHSLRAHMRKFHGTVHEKKKPYDCQICDAKFGGKFGLKSHIKLEHENLEKKSAHMKSGGSKKCPVCKEVHEFKARDRSRFFIHVGHETICSLIGNHYFFAIACHRQTYQNYQPSRQRLITY
jgi:phage FluMu protein Com